MKLKLALTQETATATPNMDGVTVRALAEFLDSEFQKFPIEESEKRAEREVILSYLSRLSLAERLKDPLKLLPADTLKQAKLIIERRLKREPLQYCLGETIFYGMRILVAKGVLIPRQDTEILVELAGGYLRTLAQSKGSLLAAELGSGSGAISLALLNSIAKLKVSACEISPEAAAISRENAALHGFSNRFSVEVSDWDDWLKKQGKFDVLLANPPYIPYKDKESLAPELRLFEPEIALFGNDEDGLGFYRDLSCLGDSGQITASRVFLEMGFAQAKTVRDIFLEHKWRVLGLHRDLNGIERVISLVPPGTPFEDA